MGQKHSSPGPGCLSSAGHLCKGEGVCSDAASPALFAASQETWAHRACGEKDLHMLGTAVEIVRKAPLATLHAAFRRGSKSATPPARLPANHDEAIAYMLNQQDSKGRTPLHIAAIQLDWAAGVRYLLAEGADPWIACKRGRMAIHYAAGSRGSGVAVEAIMTSLRPSDRIRGATYYMDARTTYGATPLMLAACASNTTALVALRAWGANLYLTTQFECWDIRFFPAACSTALHFLAYGGGSLDCACELLAMYLAQAHTGVPDPRLRKDKMGKFPFQIASDYGHADLARLLRPNGDLRALLLQYRSTACTAITTVPSLAALAGAVLRTKLTASLAGVSQAAAGTQIQTHVTDITGITCVTGIAAPRALDPSCGGASTSASSAQSLQPQCHQQACAGLGLHGACGASSSRSSMDASPSTSATASLSGCVLLHPLHSLPGQAAEAASPASAPLCTAPAAAAAPPGKEEAQKQECGVCLCEACEAAMQPCGHTLCGGCASQMCGLIQSRPMRCPFCRTPVAGFGPCAAASYSR